MKVWNNLREAGQRIRATQNVLWSQAMSEDGNYRELAMRLSTAMAMTKARRVFCFHKPETLMGGAQQSDTLRARLREMR